VWLERRTTTSTRSSGGDVHHAATRHSLTAVVTTWRDDHEGCVVTEGADGIRSAVDAALALGALLPPRPRVQRIFSDIPPDPGSAGGARVDITAPEPAMLSALSELIRDVTLDAYQAVTVFGESGGAYLQRRAARSVVQVRFSTGTGTGAMSRSYVGADPADAVAAAESALAQCLRQTATLGSPVAGGRLPADVVLHGSVVSRLLSLLAPSLQLDSVAHGRSRLADRLGERIAAPGFSLVDDAPSAFAFDDEGTRTRRVHLVTDGRLREFLSDVRTAALRDTRSTGAGWRSTSGGQVRIRPGVLLAGWDPGPAADVRPALHVLQATGMHISNDVTGDFSFGAVGVLDDDAGQLRNAGSFTVAGNVVEMLAGLRAVESPTRYVPRSVGLYGSPDIGVAGLVIGR
jgi:predicted Zn-dependent protease